MSINSTDFLNVSDESFRSLEGLTSHIIENVELEELEGDLNIIGSMSDFASPQDFKESLGEHFEIKEVSENLLLLDAIYRDVPYTVFTYEKEGDIYPIFFTPGRKTKDLPETIDRYFKTQLSVSRLWISKREMEDLRQRVVNSYPDVIMPYFTASRSRHSDVSARYRPRFDRTIQYYGDDGLETFEQMKYDYGVLPTNLKFQKANEFKFRVTTRGIFTIKNGGLNEVLAVIEDSINRLSDVKSAIDSSSFTLVDNRYSEGTQLPQSRPWAVKLQNKLDADGIQRFKREELEEDWEFVLASLTEPTEDGDSRFEAELADYRTPGRTILRSRGNTIRIYPRERTSLDQSIRAFEFIYDQIDPEATATTVS